MRAIQSKQAGLLSKLSTQVLFVCAQYEPPPKIHSNPVQPLRGDEAEEEDPRELIELLLEDVLDWKPCELVELRELEEPPEPEELVDEPLDPLDEDELEEGQNVGSGVHSNVWEL